MSSLLSPLTPSPFTPPPPIPQEIDYPDDMFSYFNPPSPPQVIDNIAEKMNFQYQHEDPISVVVNKENTVVEKGGAVAVGVVVDLHDDYISSYFNSIPIGYRFCPRDDELIDHYLNKKILNQQLPMNRIPEVELYNYDPEYLTEKYQPCREGEWYFFTLRNRIYKNGKRAKRGVGNGHWKVTGADKPIKNNGQHVGDKKVFVFLKGKPSNSEKTDWIMHEFRVKEGSICQSSRKPNDMKLDDWVLCKIYRTKYKSSKEVCHAKGSREDVDSVNGNNDRSDGFEEMVLNYPSSSVEPNSVNPAMHFTDSNCQLRSSTEGFVNDDYWDAFTFLP